MIFNETAYSIGDSIPKEELKKIKDNVFRMSQFDMSYITIFKGEPNPVICKEGWGLNDF